MIGFKPEHACKRPRLANFDYAAADLRIVNRVCITCSTHWYGEADAAVFEMPSRVWDGWINQAEAV